MTPSPPAPPTFRALLPADPEPDLARLYAPQWDRRESAHHVRVNMVASVDGGTSADGTSGALGGPADRIIFGLVRSFADVVLVGAGTMREEQYGPARLDEQSRQARLASVAWREVNDPVWAESSRRDYASRIARITSDPIAGINVARLSVGDVECWHARMRNAGVGEAAVRSRHALLRVSLSQPVRWDWVGVNVAAQARLRQPKRAPREAMSAEEVRGRRARGQPLRIGPTGTRRSLRGGGGGARRARTPRAAARTRSRRPSGRSRARRRRIERSRLG
jgi:hypothetical protein